MNSLSRDTHPEAEAVQIRIWRSWTPQERLQAGCQLTEFLRRRVRQAIREQHPNLSDDEVRIHFLRRAYGDDLAARVAQHLGISIDA